MNLRSFAFVGIIIALAVIGALYYLDSFSLSSPYATAAESPAQHKGNDGWPVIAITAVAVGILIIRWRVRVNRDYKSLKPQEPPADIVYGKAWSRRSARVGHYKHPA